MFFFTLLGAWNVLPGEVVEAEMIPTLKSYLEGHINRQGMEG